MISSIKATFTTLHFWIFYVLFSKSTTITMLPFTIFINALLVATGAQAQQARMMRFACSQLVVERLDPLVNPGVIGTPHVHQIVGGNSFNASMEPVAYDLPTVSTCTSCTFSEDFSNYWTASLYFRARNGTFQRVPQFENGGLTQSGGMTVYYISPYDGVSNTTAFRQVSLFLNG